MKRRGCSLAFVAMAITLLSTQSAISTAVSVGVKQGDWIEYEVTFVGNPPLDHDVTWARMEIVDARGVVIKLNITTIFSDGRLTSEDVTLDLEKGQLGDDFIIPSDLDVGSKFFDKRLGNVTIEGLEAKTIAGANRIIMYANTLETTFRWDRSTGVLVEATTLFPLYTMNTKTIKTNMWQDQILQVDTPIIYALVIVAVAVFVVISYIAFHMRRHKFV